MDPRRRPYECVLASEAVEDGDAALLKRDFRNAVKCYLRAMKLDKSLCSKEMSMVETPIDAINNLILLEKRDVFQSPVCFDIIEALQDRSYLKPILLKKNTMKRSTARRIVNMVGQLHCISVIRSGLVKFHEDYVDEVNPLIMEPLNVVCEPDVVPFGFHGQFALVLPKDAKQSEQQTAVNAPHSTCKEMPYGWVTETW